MNRPIKVFYIYLRNLFSLHEDKESELKTIENIKKNTIFKGTNLWILAFAILIASIGLNVNSAAVIIGAMLISPLMGPIMGVGLSLGIYDFELLKQAIRNLLIATIIGLFISSLYFSITPLNEAQSELLARTYPTIYDVLIAFVGGLTGIVAGSRSEKGNAIPGVAIATALMPPLCTAGYGLATYNFGIFLGAFYLYLINCVFICLATFLFVRFLKFPKKQYIDAKTTLKFKRLLIFIVIIMILPSIYLAYRLVNENSKQTAIEKFITNEILSKNATLISKNIKTNLNPPILELVLLGNPLQIEEIKKINENKKFYGLFDFDIKLHYAQTQLFDLSNQTKKPEYKQVINYLFRSENKKEKDKIIIPENLYQEIRILFPTIENFYILKGNKYQIVENVKTNNVNVLVAKIKSNFTEFQRKQFVNWIQTRLNNNNLEVVFVN